MPNMPGVSDLADQFDLDGHLSNRQKHASSCCTAWLSATSEGRHVCLCLGNACLDAHERVKG